MFDRVAVVSGANKGIGFEIVKGLCKDFSGVVYLTSRDENRGLAAVEKLRKLGYVPRYHQLDIADDKSIDEFHKYLEDTHKNIDILVNNAGILFRKDSVEPLLFQAKETIKVNYKGVVKFTGKILPLVRNGGRILNISSSSGHLSRIPSEDLRQKLSSPTLILEQLNQLMDDYITTVQNETYVENGWGEYPYVISKVALNAYTFMLQRENEHRDLKVSCVHPGYVASDMTDQVGNKTPEEGAAVVLYVLLRCKDDEVKGSFYWHDCTKVLWDGPDPRRYIDNLQ